MNKSSKKFDQELLNSLVGKKFPISSFEDELKRSSKGKVVISYGGITNQPKSGMVKSITM